MRCHECRELIGDLVDARISVPGEGMLREHLEVCASCRAYYAKVTQLQAQLCALPIIEPPPQVWEGIREQIVRAQEATASERLLREALTVVEGVFDRLQVVRPSFAVSVGAAVFAFILTVRLVSTGGQPPVGAQLLDEEFATVSGFGTTFEQPVVK